MAQSEQSVVSSISEKLLEEAAIYHEQHSKLSDEILTQLSSVFGSTLMQACELLENCKITKYQTPEDTRRVYKIGATFLERYTIYEGINFCQCAAFKSLLQGGNCITCKHILAIQLNKITKIAKVSTEIVTDSQFVEFLNEQLNHVKDE